MKFRIMMLLIIFLLSSCITPSIQNNVKTITIYTYQNMPPFVIDKTHNEGLSYSFVEQLNSRNAHFQYQLSVISKAELLARLDQREEMIFFWGHKDWFPAHTNLQPSQVVFWESDLLVTLKNNHLIYKEPADLIGKRFCSLESYHFPKLEHLLKNNAIKRINAKSHTDCLKLLKEKKVDAVELMRSMYLYIIRNMKNSPYLAADNSLDVFGRYIMVTENFLPHLNNINSTIKELKTDEKWNEKLVKIGGNEFADFLGLELYELLEVQINN